MKKISVLITGMILLALSSVAQTWIQEGAGFTTQSRGIMNISIVTDQIVWVSAYDGTGGTNGVQDFSKTANGGTTWTAGIVNAATGLQISQICAVSATTAYAAMYRATGSNPQGIYKTTNGGTSWTQQPSALFTNTSSFPDVINFWDANNGWCMGDPINGDFEMYTTTDGGSTWTAVPGSQIPNPLAGEYGYTADMCTFGDNVWFGTNQGRVFASTDRGHNWIVAAPAAFSGKSVMPAYSSATNGLALKYQASADTSNLLQKSTNGGASYTPLSYAGSPFSGGIGYVPNTPNTYVTTGVDAINQADRLGFTYSFDGGVTWITDAAMHGTQLTTTSWLNNTTGWVGTFNTDATDGLYKYSGTLGTFITVLSPNGGENWQIGSVHNITWSSSGVTNVKIEYTINNGSSWITIISSYPASGGSYSWTIPNNPSTQCKVRITDTGNASLTDVSNSTFIIGTTSQSVTVTSPNGGENWQVGSVNNITWSSSGVTNVKIEYTTDNGSSWTTIISTYAASAGSYSWTVPNTPSTQCRVRISDSGNASLYDMSDNVFEISIISQSITVTNPDGGENWQAGSVQNITWTSSGVTNVKIEYTTNNGTSWTTIIATYPASGGSYLWNVPNTPSTQCKVRISDSGNASLYDMSDNFFTISNGSQSILVTNPNGGENWQVGGVYNITWTSSGITNVKIEYTTDNGSSWTTILSTYAAGAGTYAWTVPNTPSTQCKVRISESGNPALFDMSDNFFTISPGSQSILVTNPNGGETWQVGSVQNITWASSGVTNVKIDYTINNGTSWITIIASYPAGAGSYPWAVPNNPSTLCKVRISDSGNASLSDISDNTFTISTGGQSTPDICIVTVDSTTNKNMVVWEKPYSTTIDHYNVYVESNQANVYTLIGSVPYNSLSIFTDYSSNSLQQSNRYKISIVDIYSTESALSDEHMTIHLTINQGMGNTINLLWNSYEGFTYPSFNIYRGTSPANMSLLATVASTLNSFTDLYPPGGYVYYKIEVVKPVPCSPSKSVIGSSISNMSTNDPSLSTDPGSLPCAEVQIFPNPTTGIINVISDRVIGEVNIYNSIGIQVQAFQADQKEMTFDLSNLGKGVYFIKMNIENKTQVHKIIVL